MNRKTNKAAKPDASATKQPKASKAQTRKTKRPPKPEPSITPEEHTATKAKPARKATTTRKLFEFYRSTDDSIIDMKGWYRVEPCDPPHQHATRRTLAAICAESYGAGNFVALQVGMNAEGKPQGLPRSYWVIKVRHGRSPAFKEVFPSDASLKNRRQVQFFIPASEDDKQREREAGGTEEEGGKLIEIEGRPYVVNRDELVKLEGHPFLSAFTLDGDVYKVQRGGEASQVAAEFLNTLPDPSITLNQLIAMLKEDELSERKIIDSLVERRWEFPTVFESGISEEAARNVAKQKLESYNRDERRQRQKAEAKQGGDKRRKGQQ